MIVPSQVDRKSKRVEVLLRDAQAHESIRVMLLQFGSVLWCALLLIGSSYLPREAMIVVLGVAPAMVMTVFLRAYPTVWLDRKASMRTAIGLVSFLWFIATCSLYVVLASVLAG